MSWFGGGLSNIQGKLTSFTAQVLNDVVETVQGSGDGDEASTEESTITTVPLDDFIALKTQHDNLTKKNHELESQVASLSRQYRNLLSSSKGQSNAPGQVDETSDAELQNLSQNLWWSDLEKWLDSQGLALPQALSDQIKRNLRNQDKDAAKHDLANEEEHKKKCEFLEQRIASLEEELESLDQQHQSALDVALTTRDHLKEENRQLNQRLAELEKKAIEIGPTIPEQLNEVQSTAESSQEILAELERYKESVNTLTAKLSTLEVVQQQNDALNSQLNQLSDSMCKLTLSHKATESKLTDENNELQAKVSTLTNQNQILSSMTSVLDRITEENRVLETNLEAVSEELKAKLAEISMLRDENAALSACKPHASEEKSTETEADSNQTKTDLHDENENLRQKLAELERVNEGHNNLKLSLEQMSENFNGLKAELVSTKEALLSSELRAETLAIEHSKLVQKLEDVTANAEAENSSDEAAGLIERLKQETSTLKEKVEALENIRSEADSQVHSLTEIRHELERELTQTQEEVQRLKLSLTELEAASGKKESEITALQSDLLSANQITQSLKRDLETTDEERISLQEQLTSLRCEMEERTQQASVSKEDAATEVDFYVEETKKMSQENAELKSRIEELCRERIRIEEQAEIDKKSLLEELKSAEVALEQSKMLEETDKKESKKLIDEIEGMRVELCNSKSQLEEHLIEKEQQSKEIETLNSETLNLREALAVAEQSKVELTGKNEELQRLFESQRNASDELNHSLEALRQKYDTLLQEKLNDSDKESQALLLTQELAQKEQEVGGLRESVEALKSEKDHFATQLQENNKERELLRETIQAFQQQREQLVQTVQQKHQEAVNYHTETLRLAKICEDLQVKLNEKATLEQEIQQLHTDNEALKANQGQWQAEMERLRSHLLSVEETYTQELLNSQAKEKALRDSLQASEERANEQSRLGDQLSGWQEKYRKSLNEKDRLEKEKAEQERSLERLQHALEQLTREKERDIVVAQKELLLKLSKSESVQNEKEAELAALRRKLVEAQQGLDAASRLTQQLDRTKEALATAKEQVLTQEKELQRVRQQMEKLQAGTEAKVDKSLVKNLLIGYFSAPSAKQKQEVLRIVATVMDFSPEDRHKTGVEDTPGGLTGWASGILRSRTRTSSGNSSTSDADKSLSEAFISFLESESTRPSTPRLPVQHPGENSPGTKATTSMTTFQPGRNEPTILRDILRDSES